MSKKENIKTFVGEKNLSSPKKFHGTNKIVCNHIKKICSIDLAEMIDYKTSNNKGFRYIYL